MPKKIAIGVVTRDNCSKTRRVEIPRLVKHRKYGKFLRSKTICYVHDENDESGEGDTVEIRESIPRSKTKRWELVRVIEKSRVVDVAALRAAAKEEKAAAEAAARSGADTSAPATKASAPTEANATDEESQDSGNTSEG